MKSFKEHLLQEAQTKAAMEMEMVIVSAAGGPKYIPKDKKISPDAGKKIIKDLKLTGKGAMPKDAYEVTSDWAKYFPKGVKGGTKTPKTDFFIGTKRISLKTGGGAQLMSGGKNEATATFYAACKAGNIDISGPIKTLEGYFKKMIVSTTPDVKGDARTLVKNQKSELVNKTNEIHQKFKKDLRDVFAKNSAFAYAFTFEAMTGVQKFGRRSPGAALYFLVTPWTGDPADIHDAFRQKNYVKKIAGRVVPEARFKSGSQKRKVAGKDVKTGFYNIYSAVGLGLTKMMEELDYLEGEILTEALLDKIKNIWNKFKNWIMKMWERVKSWIGDNWQRLVEFLALEPVIFFNNMPRW